MTGNVRVTETLKGEAASKALRVNFVENDDPAGNGPITPATGSGYRMLFLRRDKEDYRFADATFGSIQAMPLCIPPGSPALDDYARVVQRLGCALFSGKATPYEREEALHSVENETSPVAREMLAAAVSADRPQHDRKLYQSLIAALLRANYEPAIAMAEQELFAEPATGEINGRLNILLGLQFVSASRSVPLLARALKLPERELRQTAARAMQNTKSADAIDPLLAALDDGDAETQFYVMQSLGFLNHELDWRPHGTQDDPHWRECLAHWHAMARTRLGARN